MHTAHPAPLLSAQALVVHLGGRRVLDGIDVHVHKGELLGLVGPPESGKTVLLKTLAGLIDLNLSPVPSRAVQDRGRFGEAQPDACAGTIECAGQRLDALPVAQRASWRRRIGMSFQNNALFDALSVFDNVAFPLRCRKVAEDAIAQRVHERLREVGLLDAAEKMPDALSGGMQKRVGIARATIIRPEVGFFDEPTAGLDPQTAASILGLVRRLVRELGMAAIVVSSDLGTLLPVCDRVVMLYGGKVAYDGASEGMERSSEAAVRQFVTGADEGPL